MFRLLGNNVDLIHYNIKYTENGIEMIEGCTSKEYKNEVEQSLTDQGIEFTIEVIDQTNNEWFNGLEFNSYEEALEVFNAGKQAHLRNNKLKQTSSNEQLRADIDYITIMTGVDI